MLITVIVIMNRYTKMYGWLCEAFGREEFTIKEFKAVFPSPQHAKIIHDLIDSGFVKRIERGVYRVTEPSKLVEQIVEESLRQEHVLKEAERKYAYCDNDAVALWTDGYYWTGFTKGFKPIHIKALREDLGYWKRFFKGKKVEFALEGESKTLFGLTYILHPNDDFKVEIRDGVPVIPLEEVVKFCKANELTYRPALEHLDEKYNLRLFEKYEHVH
jgi:sugar-specific transcriptional regulator TrmB